MNLGVVKEKNQERLYMTSSDCLIRGDEMMARHKDFQLLGRDEELKSLYGILMRSRSNNVLIVGPSGVGSSSLCMGLESKSRDPQTPMDIAHLRKFWLDTDAMFSSGDPKQINEIYQRLSARLEKTPNDVLIIDDIRDFIEAAKSSGCSNLINSIMRDIKAKRYQAIFEARDEDLDTVMKAHSDMSEIFTILDLHEPEGENLETIVNGAAKGLEQFHAIKIKPEAIAAAIEVTSKYRANNSSLSRAQPERALTLIDRALTKYRQEAYAKSPEVAALEKRLHDIGRALEGKNNLPAELKGKNKSELESLRDVLQVEIQEAQKSWEEKKSEISKLHKEQTDAENIIRNQEDQIEILQKEAQERGEQIKSAAGSKEDQSGSVNVVEFLKTAQISGFETKEVLELRKKIETYEALAKKGKDRYDKLRDEVNASLALGREHILARFSELSGIPVSKLDEDEQEKLRNLKSMLMERIFDQDHAVESVAASVKEARIGLRDRDKPMGAFIFIGPSGVGKTELAKALAQVLYEDERALLRLDMSEFQEKHAVAKLIGAPPGYEGYEAGGRLTNEMRKNPRRIVLMDEIEKAHMDVFDICLQIVDDARLSDNFGRTVSFADSVVILTSNIGSEHFLDPNLSYEEAVELARRDLKKTLRPEFLNRFGGGQNIKFFNALSVPAIERIARRELKKLNNKLEHRGLKVEMPDEELSQMCSGMYTKSEGARGIKGFIDTQMGKHISDIVLGSGDTKGIMTVAFNETTKTLEVSSPAAAEVSAAHSQKVNPVLAAVPVQSMG